MKTAMQTYVAQFLAERQRLGFASRSMGYALGSLARYIDGLETQGPLTVEVMAAWARRPNNGSDNPMTWARRLGWINRGAHHAPRIHDLRHTFIVRRMVLWQAQGIDVDQQMLALSTYVGHAMVTNTYWYMTAVPALMASAAERFEPLLPSAEVSHV